MKKILVIVLVTLMCLSLFAGCNKMLIDTTYAFNYAYIELPNGDVVEGKVDSWKDFADGDQIQVTIDEVTYLSNSSRIVLVSGKEK